MGTFGGYMGNMIIEEAKKDMFTQDIMKLFNYGGMMQFDTVNIYGKEVALIRTPEVDEEGKVNFHFNYFEDDAWESVYYNKKTTRLGTGKIGSNEFNEVVTAAHVLYELYNNAGYAEVDGDAVDVEGYIAWINHVLGTGFSAQNRFQLWEYYESECLRRLDEAWENMPSLNDIYEYVPSSLRWAMGGVEFSDICYMIEGTGSIKKSEIVKDSYPEAIYVCRTALKKHLVGDPREVESKIQHIWDLLKFPRSERSKIADKSMQKIVEMTLVIPARMIVYLVTEICKMDFWTEWKELRNDVYHDEDISKYTKEELQSRRKIVRESAIAPIRTEEFLHNDSFFTFFRNPQELKGMPNYYLSDDERAFWWDGTDTVILSEEMEQWLTDLGTRHREIVEEMQVEKLTKEDFMKELVEILNRIEQFYKRIYAFQGMFYEFLQHSTDMKYWAAIKLLEQLEEENKETGKIIEKVGTWWDLTSKNVTFNIGRCRMKRYLSVMANQKLRMKYFGF